MCIRDRYYACWHDSNAHSVRTCYIDVELVLAHTADTLALAITSDGSGNCGEESFGVSEVKIVYFGEGACEQTAAPTVLPIPSPSALPIAAPTALPTPSPTSAPTQVCEFYQAACGLCDCASAAAAPPPSPSRRTTPLKKTRASAARASPPSTCPG